MLKKVLVLKDEIKYQENSIVSKQIIIEKGGNITLFAFSKGQGLSEHSAPFDAIVEILDGNCEIVISGESYFLEAGNTIIMPKNEPHAVKSITNFKMLLTMIFGEKK